MSHLKILLQLQYFPLRYHQWKGGRQKLGNLSLPLGGSRGLATKVSGKWVNSHFSKDMTAFNCDMTKYIRVTYWENISMNTCLFYCKRSNHIFCQKLCFYQSNFNVFIYLCVIRPVFTAFDLLEIQGKKIKVHIFQSKAFLKTLQWCLIYNLTTHKTATLPKLSHGPLLFKNKSCLFQRAVSELKMGILFSSKYGNQCSIYAMHCSVKTANSLHPLPQFKENAGWEAEQEGEET